MQPFKTSVSVIFHHDSRNTHNTDHTDTLTNTHTDGEKRTSIYIYFYVEKGYLSNGETTFECRTGIVVSFYR